jgi:hypothetical protein
MIEHKRDGFDQDVRDEDKRPFLYESHRDQHEKAGSTGFAEGKNPTY